MIQPETLGGRTYTHERVEEQRQLHISTYDRHQAIGDLYNFSSDTEVQNDPYFIFSVATELSGSPLTHNVEIAASAYLELAVLDEKHIENKNIDQGYCLEKAKTLFTDLSIDSLKDKPAIAFGSLINLAYIDLIQKQHTNEIVGDAKFLKNLCGISKHLLDYKNKLSAGNNKIVLSGLIHELTAIILLNLSIYDNNIDGKFKVIASPSLVRQDNGYVSRARKNAKKEGYDVNIGPFPKVVNKLQVKAGIYQYVKPTIVDTSLSYAEVERIRQPDIAKAKELAREEYAGDICIAFADINFNNEKYRITKLLNDYDPTKPTNKSIKSAYKKLMNLMIYFKPN